MSSFDSQRQQESLKRRSWQENFYNKKPQTTLKNNTLQLLHPGFSVGGGLDVMPPVTVVLEGRSICQRISLQKHANYQSFAEALRNMFIDQIIISSSSTCNDSDSNSESSVSIDLSNAVPGHLIAYEDMENDLLLVGDLNWKDFVRVAKRIRILPAKAKSRKNNIEDPN